MPISPPPSPAVQASRRRPVTAFDVLCLGVNAIIGSGIYLLPGHIDALLGPAAVWSFAACAVGLSFIALAFADLGRRFDRDGGPYLYAAAAFGPRLGFAVGWVAWATAIISWAAVASAIAAYLAVFIPAAGSPGAAHVVAVVVIAILAAVNVRGVRLGARVSTGLTIAKAAPLILLALVVVPRLEPARLEVFSPPGGSWAGFPAALWMALFTCQGFEVAPIIAGEVKGARRAVPFAVVGALLFSVVVYIVLQLCVSAGPARLAGSERPLSDLARAVFGAPGATFVAAAALISIIGYNAGTALSAAHYLTVLAEDGFLPGRLAARHARFGTPVAAILLTAGASAAFAWASVFERLLAISVFAVVMQYASTAAALLVLRYREGGRRLRRSLLLPAIALVVALAFLSQARAADTIVFACVLLTGLGLALIPRTWRTHRE